MHFVIHHSYLIPLLPLIGAAIAGFFGARWLRGQSHWPIWLGVGASAVLSIVLLFGMLGHASRTSTHAAGGVDAAGHHGGAAHAAAAKGLTPHSDTVVGEPVTWFEWFKAGDETRPLTKDFISVKAGAWIDPLTAVMLCVVCGIGFFITVFAAGYMKGEAGYFRFFAYLGLFIFMMTLLVMGDNLIMLYLGWEGVGLCSYLLIGYYYDKPAAREAAKKAFLVNRIGDLGFGLGIMLAFYAFGTVSYFGAGVGTNTGLFELATTDGGHPNRWALDVIPFLLMLGAFGKSAQFPLYVWLPDAMEGPTPVSALIHAATMVTAGVYMIARCGALFVQNPVAMALIALVGAFTAIFAATIALRQFDLKKVFAYSTISQLGFMFVGVGVLAPVAGVFHLVTHAFFKALLFLSSGVVMHAMLGHLDMRRMSGLKHVMPKTRILMLVGCLALAGFPLLSGFFSKDEIVAYAFHAPYMPGLLGMTLLVTAFLTAYYTFRLYFRVFEGPLVQPTEPAEGHHGAHDDHDAHAHGHASHAAVATGDTAHSGVDRAPAHGTSGGGSHGHGGGGHGHGDHGHHDHEPFVMIFPLVVLAFGAVFAGYLNYPVHAMGSFLGRSPSFQLAYKAAAGTSVAHPPSATAFGQHDPGEEGHGIAIMLISALVAVAGIGLAYLLHLKNRAAGDRFPETFAPLARLLEAKYWVDEVYQAAVVEPLRMLGKAFFAVDRFLVDGLVAVISWIPQLFGWTLKLTMQRGSLQGYASAMLFGVVVILLLIFM